jgi:hypothetical protein
MLATSAASFKGIFAAANNSTNKTNKAVGACHSSVCLSYMSVGESYMTNCNLVHDIGCYNIRKDLSRIK